MYTHASSINLKGKVSDSKNIVTSFTFVAIHVGHPVEPNYEKSDVFK